MIVLGIETSCDDTAAAVCNNGKILSNYINMQEIHGQFGGVVPELAAREHERQLNFIVNESIKRAGLKVPQIQGIAVTRGPGLAGTLLTGVSFAKGLSKGLNCPLIAVNHLEAHIFANFLADSSLKFPFICLLVSGGHTQLWQVESFGTYVLLGESRDDAAGEAFDKGARILGLGYPGGPEIEALAEAGKTHAVNFPRALQKNDNLEFSFSGLKTSLLYFMDDFKESKRLTLADVAASYQQAILDILIYKLNQAVKKSGTNTCVVAGGVAANSRLRNLIKEKMPSVNIIFPELKLCTDNGAMIAFLGEIYLKKGISSSADFSIAPNLQLA
ncbi:MAG: tRNA (adenosine(37)-N6)-threonylcarbamoyltransferase complex transferase subunit TsaD [Candidatus Neomarinimicrobiota bacterium]